MDRFQQLLYDLSELIEVPLYAEENLCRININDLFDVQMEYDSGKETVLLASFCAEIPPGRFRENVLKETLKANAIYPRVGTYGYVEQSNQLALFEIISLQNLSPEKFSDLLARFVDRVDRAKKAVENNLVHELMEVNSEYNHSAFHLI